MKKSINLTTYPAAQDMVNIIMRDKNFTAKEAIEFAINRDNCMRILKEGYAGIAYDLWGHAEPEREWDELDNPIIQIELSDSQRKLIDIVVDSEKTNSTTAICYFLVFTMDFLGYHI